MGKRIKQETTVETTASAWVGIAQACAIVGRTPRRIHRLVIQGHVRTHRPPGMLPRYYRPDLEKYSPAAVLAESANP